MTNTNQLTDNALTETFVLISRNICTQLVSLQRSIDAREEHLRYPTPQDIAMQCKLIGCLDKLRKLSGEKVIAKPRRMAKQTPDAEIAAESAPILPKQEAAPITEQDFKDYKHLLTTFKNLRDTDTIRFRGRFVNSKWLQYNLLQYCLPEAERVFIGDARRVMAEVDPAITLEKVKQYAQQKIAA